jgi:hypothetical protein
MPDVRAFCTASWSNIPLPLFFLVCSSWSRHYMTNHNLLPVKALPWHYINNVQQDSSALQLVGLPQAWDTFNFLVQLFEPIILQHWVIKLERSSSWCRHQLTADPSRHFELSPWHVSTCLCIISYDACVWHGDSNTQGSEAWSLCLLETLSIDQLHL